jgi:hypothetical protein
MEFVRPLLNATAETVVKYAETCHARVAEHLLLYPNDSTMVPMIQLRQHRMMMRATVSDDDVHRQRRGETIMMMRLLMVMMRLLMMIMNERDQGGEQQSWSRLVFDR